MAEDDQVGINDLTLFSDIRKIILDTQKRVSNSVNSAVILMNWKIGDLINRHILEGKRAAYGKNIIQSLSVALTQEFGSGYSRKNLFNCLRVAETFPDPEIVSSLSRKLSGTHLKTLAYIEDQLKRDFYVILAQREGWNTRALGEKIQSMLFERTAISKKPEQLIIQELEKMKSGEILSPELVFRDPYILDFLNLRNVFSENDLESAILSELQLFLAELGTDFAFLARQKRIIIDEEDHYIDLLFFHRGLRRLFVIDLKLGKFQARDKGQMELYLKWLEKYEMKEGEESPVGLILCAEKSAEKIELLQLDKGNIRVAEYITELPSRQLLAEKLNRAIEIAKEKLNQNM
ncbi:MAG: DUF1016 domain-containing protein [Bacteroidia bacterium]|nr:DUF1016 domain-containing protein [Bacteroidia bacterium]